MWQRFSLRPRVFLIVSLLMLITVGSGIFSIYSTYRMNALVASMVNTDIFAFRTAQELSRALVMQKGYVTYYFQDRDPKWLKQLQEYHLVFKGWINKARATAINETERDILNQIELEYIHYHTAREQVINYYKTENHDAGFKLHQEIRRRFFHIHILCERFREAHNQHIQQVQEEVQSQARFMRNLVLAAMSSTIVLGGLLAYILLIQILKPIRDLTMEAGPANSETPVFEGDEVEALTSRVHNLIEDVDQTKTKLERSRVHLEQTEKLAMVGKLAAGVSHSIRNPLTSVKMRLFSMERNLELSPTLKEDFEVISEEIRHIDSIVRNFLEFSRVPKLKMQRISPSDVVDTSLELLGHRLGSYGVEVMIQRKARLPEIFVDPDQMKEVLINLVENALEAMVSGGHIRIEEEEQIIESLGKTVVIKVRDNGPGIPQSVQDSVFEPFFSTKEEGTGLGLSIATRIVEEHGGWLDLSSEEGEGTTFIITLPLKEDEV
ncbi:MAG: MCP four helix bundle domain-containing protein [Deltaproteobacteria bacterium]|nr:MCP four helix bundle domain-containing protein [Deltaproteobacteria bacterium]